MVLLQKIQLAMRTTFHFRDISVNGPRLEPVFFFSNNKGADQPTHPRRLISQPAHSRRLISAFYIRFLESIISKLRQANFQFSS